MYLYIVGMLTMHLAVQIHCILNIYKRVNTNIQHLVLKCQYHQLLHGIKVHSIPVGSLVFHQYFMDWLMMAVTSSCNAEWHSDTRSNRTTLG